MILLILAVIIFCALCVMPSIYSRHIINKHSHDLDHIPGNGAQLATHLVKAHKLQVTVAETPIGDHYDPITKTVGLSNMVMTGKSLSAVAISAHEVGHAIQDNKHSLMLRIRTKLVAILVPAERLVNILFWLAPVTMLWSYKIGLVLFILAFAILGVRVLIHIVTLPVEFDASFGKALPILKKGQYLQLQDYQIIRQILLACALTYVSAALMELVNIWRWLRIARRA